MSITQWFKMMTSIILAAFPLPVDMIKREEGVDGSSDIKREEVANDYDELELLVIANTIAKRQMRQRWGVDRDSID